MSKGKEQKPVILQVLPELDHGGVEVGTVQIADALRQHGIKNFVASAGGRMVHDLEKIKVPYITLPLKTKNPIKLYLNSLKLEKIIKENGVNIVHARSRAPAWSAYWAAKRAGVKFMTTFHGTYGLGPKGIKKFYNRVMTYGQLVIAISNHIKKHITENYRINEDKIRLIHRCVDIEKFSPAAVSQERIIRAVQENGIPEDLPVISLIGRITRWKGQHVLLEALSKLKDRDFFCLIVGSDQGRVKYTEELKELVKKYGKPWKVNHIGSLGWIYFTDQDVENYEDAKTSDTEEFARYFHYMLEHGIHLGPSQFEAMFLSNAHTEETTKETLGIFEGFLKQE